MTGLMMEDRIRRYTRGEMDTIMSEEGVASDDVTFLTGITTFAIVAEVPGSKTPKLGGMPSVDIPVFEVTNYPTGIYMEPGHQPVILLNEGNTVMDYDFISELHPQHDCEVYLWISAPWKAADSEFGIHGEWYRSDVYPDGMKEFAGVLDWEDLAPVMFGED